VSPSGEPSVTEKNVQRGGAEIGRRAWIDALRMAQRSIEGRGSVAPRRSRLPDDLRGPARDLGGNIGAVAAGDEISAPARHYLNRLSDLLFVLARVENRPEHGGAGDVLWVPGASR
jgi:hypothetical protein